jgi:hypothetical protein
VAIANEGQNNASTVEALVGIVSTFKLTEEPGA